MCTSSHSTVGCTSVTFPTHGVPHTKVCGRAIAYQRCTDDAFLNYHSRGASDLWMTTTNVNSLSVKHEDFWNYIWIFAAGISKEGNYPDWKCPCASPYPGPGAPPFMGNSYFCESGIIGTINSDCGSMTTPFGIHRAVKVGALAVLKVVHGSLPHWARKWAMTLKWGCALVKTQITMKTSAWNNSR